VREAIEVLDQSVAHSFAFDDLLRYHGPGSPAGVAHAFKVLQRGLPLLDGGRPPERRELSISTAFGGPGARDGFELVTRAVTEGRYTVDAALRRSELGAARERFVFCLAYRGTQVTLALRSGFVSDEFARLAFADARTDEEARRLDELKPQLARRLLAAPAEAVYEASRKPSPTS